MTAPDPSTLSLRPDHPRQISLRQAIAYATRFHPTPSAQLMAYLNELSRLSHATGYDFGVLVAQSAEETNAWQSQDWTARLNPAGLGHDPDKPAGIRFPNGTDAARAHLVHMAAYVEGKVAGTVLAIYQDIDPLFARVLSAGFGGTVKTVADLGSGKWATDPNYPAAIAARYAAILAQPTSQPGPVAPADAAALLPPITWVDGCPNWHPRPNGMKPVAIVRHCTDDENVENVLSWFKNPSSQASAHFVIDRETDPKTGYAKVYQLVGSGNAAWTNGDYATLVDGVWRLNQWRTDIPWLVDAIQLCMAGGSHNLNDWTIGIEHVCTPDNPPNPGQYKSSIALGRYFGDARIYGITPNRGHQLRHADIDHVDRAYCPGPQFDLEGIITALGGDPKDLVS